MEPYSVTIFEPADQDVAGILRYISVELAAPKAATDLMRLIRTQIQSLENSPQRYPLVADEHFAAMGYRKLIIKNYIVFFTIDEAKKTMNVERVLYGRRDWNQIL